MSQPTTSDVHIPTTDRKKADADLTPTAEMAAAAKRALEWRRQYGRGGTMVGVARARDIANGKALSPQTIARMVSFFARHGNNRAEHYELRDGKPTTWRIAWDLWGGDPARGWANRKQEELQKMDITKANHSKAHCMMCKENPPALDVLWNGGQSRAWFCDKCFGKWSLEKGTSIVNVNRLSDGVVPSRYSVRHSPNEKRSSGGKDKPRRSGGKGSGRQSGGRDEGRQSAMKSDTVLRINGQEVTLADLARAWLAKEDKYTSAPWSSPESDLSADDFAKVCLIDLNPPGEDKTKANCKLPYKSTPDGPVNLNALRAIAVRLPQTDAPAEALKAAARKLVSLMRGAGIEPGEATLARAGMTAKETRVEKSWEFEEITKDSKRQVVYGVILRPKKKDSQGDKVDPEEIMSAAHIYMAKRFGAADLKHIEEISRARAVMVESFVLGTDVDEWHGKRVKLAKDTWIGGMWIPDQNLWKQVEDGEISAFSIRGWGKRTPVLG